jgi:hypothetical protein
MAFGDSPCDAELQADWEAFCDRLKSAGRCVFKDENASNELQRVDGFRYLTQNLSQAFDLAVETKDTRYPALLAFCSPTRKLGSDNADCVYQQAHRPGGAVSGAPATIQRNSPTISVVSRGAAAGLLLEISR